MLGFPSLWNSQYTGPNRKSCFGAFLEYQILLWEAYYLLVALSTCWDCLLANPAWVSVNLKYWHVRSELPAGCWAGSVQAAVGPREAESRRRAPVEMLVWEPPADSVDLTSAPRGPHGENRDKWKRWGENEARGQVSQFTLNLTNTSCLSWKYVENHTALKEWRRGCSSSLQF